MNPIAFKSDSRETKCVVSRLQFGDLAIGADFFTIDEVFKYKKTGPSEATTISKSGNPLFSVGYTKDMRVITISKEITKID